MSEVRAVLAHLLEGRGALVLEVQRLTTAIEELDSVIARVGGSPAGEPVNRSARAAGAPKARRGAKRGETPKSIRVHVLEMLTAEADDLPLAEIINRVHQAGVRAHDDAVRSITVKLMKDGKVERVGRGRYRLTRPGTAAPDRAPIATEHGA